MRKKADPTLNDVFEAVQNGFGAMGKRLDKTEERVEGVGKRLDGVEQRLGGVERRLIMVETRMSGIEDTNRHVVRRIGELENKMDEVQEVVEGLSKAFDHDTVMVMEHDKRLARLEKRS